MQVGMLFLDWDQTLSSTKSGGLFVADKHGKFPLPRHNYLHTHTHTHSLTHSLTLTLTLTHHSLPLQVAPVSIARPNLRCQGEENECTIDLSSRDRCDLMRTASCRLIAFMLAAYPSQCNASLRSDAIWKGVCSDVASGKHLFPPSHAVAESQGSQLVPRLDRVPKFACQNCTRPARGSESDVENRAAGGV
jgi:hypothetical protein